MRALRAADDRLPPGGPDALLAASLPGTWELLSRVDKTDTGEQRAEASLGTDPIAWLIYDRAGHFAAQFMKRTQSGIDNAPSHAASPNNTRALRGYDAYFGTYEIDEARGEVTQRLLGAVSRENVGQTLRRTVHVAGDRMTIALRTTAADGQAVTRTLTWRRIG